MEFITRSRAYGYTLVAPKEHREQVTGDFTMEEYLDLQQLLYRVTEGSARGGRCGEDVHLHLRLQPGQLTRPLARRPATTWGALRGAAGRLGQLEQGRALDTLTGDGHSGGTYRVQDRADLPGLSNERGTFR